MSIRDLLERNKNRDLEAEKAARESAKVARDARAKVDKKARKLKNAEAKSKPRKLPVWARPKPKPWEHINYLNHRPEELTTPQPFKYKQTGTTQPLPGRLKFEEQIQADKPQKKRKEKKKKSKAAQANPLDGSVQAMGYEDYEAYLLSDHWKQVRGRYAVAWKDCRCVACGHPTFQLHHITYTRIGKERLKDLVPLCVKCHGSVHLHHRIKKIPLRFVFRVLQELFKWSDSELARRFAPYHALPD
jgi:hypothetical protein